MTLAMLSATIYCPAEQRSLLPLEILVGQGCSLVQVDGTGAKVKAPIVDTFTAAALTRLAGNATSGPCIGSVLWWVLLHGFSQRVVSLPKSVLLPEAQPADQRLGHLERDEQDNNSHGEDAVPETIGTDLTR